MGVQVDKTGRDDQAASIDRRACETGPASANLRDSALFNPDIAPIARDPGAVDNGSALDMDVELRHDLTLRIATSCSMSSEFAIYSRFEAAPRMWQSARKLSLRH